MLVKSRGVAVLLASVWLLAGCARSAPVAYYLLTAVPLEHQAATAPLPSPAVIGIGPLTLPEYLDRPQIVSRRNPNRLELADRQRWAEPLADNIALVLQENLARDLGGERVLLYPWSPGPGVDRQVSVEVIRFETGADVVQFEARWTVQDREGKVLLQRRSSQRLKVAQPPDYDRQVAALSEALARFAAEIAAALRELAALRPGNGEGTS